MWDDHVNIKQTEAQTSYRELWSGFCFPTDISTLTDLIPLKLSAAFHKNSSATSISNTLTEPHNEKVSAAVSIVILLKLKIWRTLFKEPATDETHLVVTLYRFVQNYS